MAKKKKPSDIFQEEYLVNLDYQKPDGFWVCSHIDYVYVTVRHGVNEKDNHAEAEAIAKKKYKICKINRVIYC